MIEKHVIEIRKEMNEKRQQDEEQRKQYVHNFHQSINVRFSRSTREYDNAKSERTKAEHERTRKEEELHKLKEIALKEQNNLSEKRLQTLVDDFIRMKALTVRQPDLSRLYLISNSRPGSTETLLRLAECCPGTTLTDGSSSSLSRLEVTLSVSCLLVRSLPPMLLYAIV